LALNVRSNTATAVKICGITKIHQALEIASLGADAIGVIGVENSPRFIHEPERRELFNELELKAPNVERVWVVADPSDEVLFNGINGYGLPSVVQLHGNESIQRCNALKETFPHIRWWKALRVKREDDLELIKGYESTVDAILLDAWTQNVLGGTGEKLPIEWLKNKEFSIPWWLAGGISSQWIGPALREINPDGVDASSKLERYPGVKDLNKVKSLLNIVKNKQKLL